MWRQSPDGRPIAQAMSSETGEILQFYKFDIEANALSIKCHVCQIAVVSRLKCTFWRFFQSQKNMIYVAISTVQDTNKVWAVFPNHQVAQKLLWMVATICRLPLPLIFDAHDRSHVYHWIPFKLDSFIDDRRPYNLPHDCVQAPFSSFGL